MKAYTFYDFAQMGACYDSFEEFSAATGITDPNLGTILDILQNERIKPDYRIWAFTRKGVVSEAILTEFALICADHALPIWEAIYPNDKRPNEAIRIKRLHMNGEATAAELSEAVAAVAASRATRWTTWATGWISWAPCAAWASSLEYKFQLETAIDLITNKKQ